MIYLKPEIKEKLMNALNDKELFYNLLMEIHHLSEIDCLVVGEKCPFEKFKDKLLELGEHKFLKILEEYELI